MLLKVLQRENATRIDTVGFPKRCSQVQGERASRWSKNQAGKTGGQTVTQVQLCEG